MSYSQILFYECIRGEKTSVRQAYVESCNEESKMHYGCIITLINIQVNQVIGRDFVNL